MKLYKVFMEAKVYGFITVEAESQKEATKVGRDEFNLIDDNNTLEFTHIVTEEIKEQS